MVPRSQAGRERAQRRWEKCLGAMPERAALPQPRGICPARERLPEGPRDAGRALRGNWLIN